MINSELFQEIFSELNKYLFNEWEKLVAYFEYGNSSYTFSFYEKIHGQYINCYNLPDITIEELTKSFDQIDNLLSKERNKEKEDLWTSMTMVVSESGDMHTDFDYSDLTEQPFERKLEWKAKYLGNPQKQA